MFHVNLQGCSMDCLTWDSLDEKCFCTDFLKYSNSMCRIYTFKIYQKYQANVVKSTIVPWILSRGWLEAAFLPEKLPSFWIATKRTQSQSLRPCRFWYKKGTSQPWSFHGKSLRGPKCQGFVPKKKLTGGNSNIFYFHLYLGKWSNLTNIFQSWNHQPE